MGVGVGAGVGTGAVSVGGRTTDGDGGRGVGASVELGVGKTGDAGADVGMDASEQPMRNTARSTAVAMREYVKVLDIAH